MTDLAHPEPAWPPVWAGLPEPLSEGWGRLLAVTGRGSLMNKFRITYLDGQSEEISARGYGDIGDKWIEFRDGTNTQLLRVAANTVARIEIVRS